MDLVIVESPYAGEIERNLAYARKAMRDCFDRGEAPFASHLLYTQEFVLDDSIPQERAKGIQGGYEWMMKADRVCFYIDLGWSRGMLQALRMARLQFKEIEARSLRKKVIQDHKAYFNEIWAVAMKEGQFK